MAADRLLHTLRRPGGKPSARGGCARQNPPSAFSLGVSCSVLTWCLLTPGWAFETLRIDVVRKGSSTKVSSPPPRAAKIFRPAVSLSHTPSSHPILTPSLPNV
eukprot:2734891-Rhodomonas_salina.1